MALAWGLTGAPPRRYTLGLLEDAMTPLTGDARAQALAALPAWAEVDGRDAICRTYTFADFASAFTFMTRVAFAAEAANHHPEWFNVYNRVDVTLSTHDAGGLTAKDTALAAEMDRVAAALGA